MKFDYVIGNPPYQDVTDSDSTRMPPIYNFFMDAAYSISDRVELITPARFLFDAGYTPKDWNLMMLNDEHFKVLFYEPDSSQVFKNTDIKGGVAVTYRDANKAFGAIGTFTKFPELNLILKKVKDSCSEFLDLVISSPLSFQLTDAMKKDHPNLVDRLRSSAFTNLSEIFYEKKPQDQYEYISMIGLLNGKRVYRYIRKDYIKDSSGTLNKYCLLLPKANGAGSFGETLSPAAISKPNEGYTQTFIAIGKFDEIKPAENVEKYIKTKFARSMLGVLKITQDCPAPKWKYVPLQDFTPASDIDWSKSVAEIDRQLYAKYGLSQEEIDFIETHVKEME
ncbi:MAG: Eco57I restriction-modification methylase domain-containing protein [Ruminococcus sp.]|nr:Eco57I restriction-modification methylase domain-containing protein [Ruminococcus sp.]